MDDFEENRIEEERHYAYVNSERVYPDRDYSMFDKYLCSLDDQLELLRCLNRRMPSKLKLDDSLLDLDTSSAHVQGVDDLEHFYVSFPSLGATWAFNQKLIEFTQPYKVKVGFSRDKNSMKLNHLAYKFSPGVHRVRINLVDNWDPKLFGRSLDTVISRASRLGKKLAGIEILGAFALQDPKLFQSQSVYSSLYRDEPRGLETIPHLQMAGLHLNGGPWYCVPVCVLNANSYPNISIRAGSASPTYSDSAPTLLSVGSEVF
jgi:hypothetical protein